jgi:hypothetical protein
MLAPVSTRRRHFEMGKTMKKMSTKLGAVLTAGVVVAAILPATPAFALGNNRTVSRSCGSNYVSSGFNGSQGWAQTEKSSGNCTGQLGVTLIRSDGYRLGRVNGTTSSARIVYATSNRPQNGVHWGCLNCNQTLS